MTSLFTYQHFKISFPTVRQISVRWSHGWLKTQKKKLSLLINQGLITPLNSLGSVFRVFTLLQKVNESKTKQKKLSCLTDSVQLPNLLGNVQYLCHYRSCIAQYKVRYQMPHEEFLGCAESVSYMKNIFDMLTLYTVQCYKSLIYQETQFFLLCFQPSMKPSDTNLSNCGKADFEVLISKK